jgi:hypothetical protein
MLKGLLLIAAIGVAAYFIIGRKTVSGTVTADYSGAKVSSPGLPLSSDSAQTALTGPAQYTY